MSRVFYSGVAALIANYLVDNEYRIVQQSIDKRRLHDDDFKYLNRLSMVNGVILTIFVCSFVDMMNN